MKPTLLPLLVAFTFLGLASHSLAQDDETFESTNLAHGIYLREKADQGDAKAMYKLAVHLGEHAPDKDGSDSINICNGKKVSAFARKKLEAQGAECGSDIEAHKVRLKNWKPVGYKSDFDYWLNEAAESGYVDAIAIRCALGGNMSNRLKKACSSFESGN